MCSIVLNSLSEKKKYLILTLNISTSLERPFGGLLRQRNCQKRKDRGDNTKQNRTDLKKKQNRSLCKFPIFKVQTLVKKER